MLQHNQTVTINAGLEDTWRFVSDMANWAGNMPGYRSYEVMSETDSVWTLKVGVGALVKTVRVHVHIEEWREPDRVGFTYKLENEPVDGGGFYQARALSGAATEATLFVEVRGEGPMSPVWEAMAKPVLPKLARDFSASLKELIEERLAAQPETLVAPPAPKPGWLQRLSQWVWKRADADGFGAQG